MTNQEPSQIKRLEDCYRMGCDCQGWINKAITAGFTEQQAIFLHTKLNNPMFSL